MNGLPRRIKNIEEIIYIRLKKFRNLFIIFWLFNLAGAAHLGNIIREEGSSESLTLIAGLIALFSLVFLYKTVNVLYINRYKNGAVVGFILSWILPFGGFISFIIFLQVLFDSRKVLKILSVKNASNGKSS